MISRIFSLCVDWLYWLAGVFGTTYAAVNVWIFCVIGPVVFLIVFGMMLYYRAQYRDTLRCLTEVRDEFREIVNEQLVDRHDVR